MPPNSVVVTPLKLPQMLWPPRFERCWYPVLYPEMNWLFNSCCNGVPKHHHHQQMMRSFLSGFSTVTVHLDLISSFCHRGRLQLLFLSVNLSVQTVDPRCFHSSGTLPHFTVACTHTLTHIGWPPPPSGCVCALQPACFLKLHFAATWMWSGLVCLPGRLADTHTQTGQLKGSSSGSKTRLPFTLPDTASDWADCVLLCVLSNAPFLSTYINRSLQKNGKKWKLTTTNEWHLT